MSDINRPSIYLDNAATTQPAPEVIAAMREALELDYGNPSSHHGMGLAADKRLRVARMQVARRLGVPPQRIVFTSGGTEALALAILGTINRRRDPGRLLISQIEHSSVLNTARLAERQGHHIDIVPVTAGGWIDPQEVIERLRDDTFLVAVMHINNEIGIIQPVAQIAAGIKRRCPSCLFLVDAVQSAGVIDTSLPQLGADFLALSAHKFHGPKGVGALALGPGVQIDPLWGGGKQEGTLRSGTENVPGIVGLGVALDRGKGPAAALQHAVDRLVEPFLERVPSALVLGDATRRAPHIAAIALPGVRSDVIVNGLAERGVYLSSGAACQSRSSRRSHVLQGLGVSESYGVIRISPGRFTSADAIHQAREVITNVIEMYT